MLRSRANLFQGLAQVDSNATCKLAARSRPWVSRRWLSVKASSTGAGAKVVGMGSAGVDYLASVAEFPKPDQKLRTDALEVQGGGNCANALTAAARLGVSPTLISKIGDDGLGDGIISELERDGVDASHVLRAAGSPSPFTYIIVDRAGSTRTCIHTPGAALTPEEMTLQYVDQVLQGAKIIYFDGRLTEAALVVAAAARRKGIIVLVEAERLRPSIEQLLQFADIVVTSTHFPQEFTGEATLADAILAVFEGLPHVRMMVTTLGKQGSILLDRSTSSSAPSPSSHPLTQVPLADILAHPEQHCQPHQPLASANIETSISSSASSDEHIPTSRGSTPGRSDHGSRPTAADGNGHAAGSTVAMADCISKSGVHVQRGSVWRTREPVHLLYSSSRDISTAKQRASQAAAAAARANADSGSAARYAASAAQQAAAESSVPCATVYVATTAHLPKGAVADTTGAGDSFIGTIVYSIASGKEPGAMLSLASVVAAAKCTALGARPGLPHRHELSAELLQLGDGLYDWKPTSKQPHVAVL